MRKRRAAHDEEAGPTEDYGLRIGKAHRDFFNSVKSLRDLLFDGNTDRFRKVKFKVMNPKESFEEL